MFPDPDPDVNQRAGDFQAVESAFVKGFNVVKVVGDNENRW